MYKTKDISGKLAEYFIKSPLTFILGVSILAVGALALQITPREENPQMVVSGSSVIVALPGANAEEVNEIITKPLERKLKEVIGIQHITSASHNDYAIVNAEFFIGQEKKESDVKVYDKIMKNLDILPKGAHRPIIKTLDIDTDIPIMSIAFYSESKKLTEVTKKVEKIQHQINALSGVAETSLKGNKKDQFNVLIDPKKVAAYNLSVGQIAKALEGITYNLPAFKNTSPNGELTYIKIKNVLENQKDIENIMVASYLDSPIYLRDVATVELDYNIQDFKGAEILAKVGDQIIGFEQVTLSLSKLKGENSVIITDSAEKLLQSIRYDLDKEDIQFTIIKNDGQKANAAVNELVHHLVISILIIGILLILVLGTKEAIIVIFTVPAILAITLFVAYLSDSTINRITLFSFLLALGLLVDAAIIVIENIHRHMHISEKNGTEINQEELFIKATDEVGPPTNIATLAIILTMVPMAFVGGMMGQFMQPIPANVPVALIASLFIAYIFTPYLANKMMKINTKGNKKK